VNVSHVVQKQSNAFPMWYLIKNTPLVGLKWLLWKPGSWLKPLRNINGNLRKQT